MGIVFFRTYDMAHAGGSLPKEFYDVEGGTGELNVLGTVYYTLATMLVNVVMCNMLVTIMSETFVRVQAQMDALVVRERASLLSDIDSVLPFWVLRLFYQKYVIFAVPASEVSTDGQSTSARKFGFLGIKADLKLFRKNANENFRKTLSRVDKAAHSLQTGIIRELDHKAMKRKKEEARQQANPESAALGAIGYLQARTHNQPMHTAKTQVVMEQKARRTRTQVSGLPDEDSDEGGDSPGPSALNGVVRQRTAVHAAFQPQRTRRGPPSDGHGRPLKTTALASSNHWSAVRQKARVAARPRTSLASAGELPRGFHRVEEQPTEGALGHGSVHHGRGSVAGHGWGKVRKGLKDVSESWEPPIQASMDYAQKKLAGDLMQLRQTQNRLEKEMKEGQAAIMRKLDQLLRPGSKERTDTALEPESDEPLSEASEPNGW